MNMNCVYQNIKVSLPVLQSFIVVQEQVFWLSITQSCCSKFLCTKYQNVYLFTAKNSPQNKKRKKDYFALESFFKL